MKLFITLILLLFLLQPAFSQSRDGLVRPETMTLDVQAEVKAQSDETVELDIIGEDGQMTKATKVLKKSLDYKGRKLFEIKIDIDKKDVPDPVSLYVRVFMPEPFFEIYQGSITTSKVQAEVQEGLSYINGKFRLIVANALAGHYIIQIRMIDSDNQLYIFEREITV